MVKKGRREVRLRKQRVDGFVGEGKRGEKDEQNLRSFGAI